MSTEPSPPAPSPPPTPDHSPALRHALSFFEARAGALVLGRRPARDLVERHGSPCYVYDLAVMRRKARALAAAFGPRFALHYALKANPHPAVIRCFLDLGFGLDVASGQELSRALSVGADSAEIGFAGPGKSDAELELAIRVGLGQINCESVGELRRLEALAARLGRRAQVALRVNPPQAVKASGMRMGGGAAAFGIDAEQIPEALAILRGLAHVDFVGFHIYAGSQNLKVEPLVANLRAALDLVLDDFWPHCPRPPRFLNLGGGFGIPYAHRDTPLDLAAVGAAAQALVAERGAALDGVQLVLESGRYLTGEAGVYLCRVRDLKTSRGKTFAVTDGGLHHHLAATGNFGQVIHRPYPVAAADHLDAACDHPTTVVGPLCTPLDTFGADLPLPPLAVGDLIAVFCSGAYGFSASPRGFLSHPEPAEVVVDTEAQP